MKAKLRYSHLAFVALREVLDLETTAHVGRVLRVILQTPSPADVERRLTHQIADHFATRHHSVHQRDGKRQRLAAKNSTKSPVVLAAPAIKTSKITSQGLHDISQQ
jgi:hypothetical protein